MDTHLQPEQRTDRNGRTQRRWVRQPTSGAAKAGIPAPTVPPTGAPRPTETALERLTKEAFGEDDSEGGFVLRVIGGMKAPIAEAYERIAEAASGHEDAVEIVRGVINNGGIPDRALLVMRECADLLPDIRRAIYNPAFEANPYRPAVDAIRERTDAIYSRYTGTPTPEQIRQTGPLLRAAVLAGLVGLTEGLSSPFEEHALYAAVQAHFETLRAKLPALKAMADILKGTDVRGDTALYAEICEAAGDNDGVFVAIAEMAVERGRLDRDEALAVARGGTPAMASGVL